MDPFTNISFVGSAANSGSDIIALMDNIAVFVCNFVVAHYVDLFEKDRLNR
jgi:hypothetical protein